MWNFAVGSQQNKDVIVAAGAVRLLIVLLRSDHSDPQAAAAGALRDLAASCQQNWDAIIAAGAVPMLVALLE